MSVMSRIRTVESLTTGDTALAGGKAVHLGALSRSGFDVPRACVIVEESYRAFVDDTGLRGRILLELGRKDREQMRWEEMWDASLRIRHMFSTTAWPGALRDTVAPHLDKEFDEVAVVVRSSAPEEDTGRASFAGVHASFVNVRGVDSILEHVKLVWASLFSDRALLYSKEVNLDLHRSSMAVIVQELVRGECSGVVFTESPIRKDLSVIEAVHGLNQGLVDGTIPPDRWMISRETGLVESHEEADRSARMVIAPAGVTVQELPAELRTRPPLDPATLSRVWRTAMEVERRFDGAQDVEWTLAGKRVFILQARPITTLKVSEIDPDRAWYLSLRRSFENLEQLRRRIEEEHLPAMAREAEVLASRDLEALSDGDLDAEIQRRRRIHDRWHATYWDEMIPLAHGVRLFGELYNAVMEPDDPFEFVQLLEGTRLRGLERNDRLLALARRWNPEAGQEGLDPEDPDCLADLETLLEEFGGVFGVTVESRAGWERLLSRLAGQDPRSEARDRPSLSEMERRYLDRFHGQERGQARGILDLARASYRLRDDDNLYLGRIEAQVQAADQERQRRGRAPANRTGETDAEQEIVLSAGRMPARSVPPDHHRSSGLQPRQLIGQPAGRGVARGPVRVIHSREDLFDFEEGEVLVCDAVDPNMTFVVPLARAVVERRGGMLIHGAIIAREYGLPCVTGIPEAAERLGNGDDVTVDGYLGIVTVHASAPRRT